MKEDASQIYLLTDKEPSTRRILVIDDDQENMEILIEPLRWEGYNVKGVTNEDEALQLIERIGRIMPLRIMPLNRAYSKYCILSVT